MDDIYKTFTLEDFMNDDRFIDWVLNGEKSKEWEIWLSDNPVSYTHLTLPTIYSV